MLRIERTINGLEAISSVDTADLIPVYDVSQTTGTSTKKMSISQLMSSLGSASIVVSDTVPSNPTVGLLWFNSSTLRLKVYYNDGSSLQWVDVIPQGSYPLDRDILSPPEDLTISRNVASPGTHLDISPGRVLVPSPTSRNMAINTSTWTKRIDQAWASGTGNGGRFSGSVANGQTWHIFLIRNIS